MNPMKIVAVNAVSIICAGASAYMAISDIQGWGWFLFIAVITLVYPKKV